MLVDDVNQFYHLFFQDTGFIQVQFLIVIPAVIAIRTNQLLNVVGYEKG